MSQNKNGKGGDYEVGYGKPPKHTQFKKDQSGNLKGAPTKRKREAVDVAGVLNEPVTVTQAGKRQEKQPFEVTLRRLVKDGLEGKKQPSILQFISLCEKYGVMKPPPVDQGGGVVFAPKGMTVEEWLDIVAEEVPQSELEEDDDE